MNWIRALYLYRGTRLLWTSERLSRVALFDALGCGAGLAVYMGPGFGRRRLGRRRLGGIWRLQLPGCGADWTGDRCGAALGARGRTLHSANVELAPTCADGPARSEVWTLEDLLSAAPARSRALDRYRIIGYPLSPLIGAPESTTLARAVFAPGPDDALPVVPLFEAVAATVS